MSVKVENKKATDAAARPAEEGKVQPVERRGLYYTILLAVSGLLVSVQLLRIHLSVGAQASSQFGCMVDEVVDCAAPALSEQAYFLGLPVPAWAIATYLLVLCMGLLSLLVRRKPWSHASDYVLPVAAWSVAYSAYLAWVSAFQLETYCAWCAGLYAVNTGLLFASFMVSPRRGWLGRRMEDLRWLFSDPVKAAAAVLILVLAGASLAAYNTVSEKDRSIVEFPGGIQLDLSQDPVLGAYRAPITIIEFSDFECPACRKMHEVVSLLLKEYRGKVRVVQKSYPLDSQCNPGMSWRMHPHACDAAYAAECAFRQGEYREYSEKLWTAQDLGRDALVEMAAEQGMDKDEFVSCMESEETRQAVLADIAAGDKLGLQATPTFVSGNFMFTGYKDPEWCRKLIDRFLQGEATAPRARRIGED